MANLVFLIGNGFDLNCGLKSRYVDAYKYYCSKTDNGSEIIKKFKKDLLDNHENWSDFEMGISKYAQNLSNENELIECIRDFRKSLKEYLTLEESKFYDYVNKEEGLASKIADETRKSINTFYNGVSSNISRIIKQIDNIAYITFNYTSILDNFIFFQHLAAYEVIKYKLGCVSDSVIHIHGSFHNSTPVLGMDRMEQLQVSYDLTTKGKRTVIKPVFNSDVDEIRIQSAKSAIANANYICVFGLSLGLSDLTWRETIVSWLNQSVFNQLFVYDYSAYEKIELDDDERLDAEQDLKSELFSEWGIEISSPLWKQIHMPCGNRIFNYREVIENYIKSKE